MDNNQDDNIQPEMDEDQAREICQALDLENCSKEVLEAARAAEPLLTKIFCGIIAQF